MPKKRKTRKEKLQHDQKRQPVHSETKSIISSPKKETQQQKQEAQTSGMTFSLPAKQQEAPKVTPPTKQSSTPISISHSEYGYLSNDLMRTALLTGAIVFAELFIKLFIVH